MSAAAPVPGTIYSAGSDINNANLATIHDSVVDGKGWQATQYGDVDTGFVYVACFLVLLCNQTAVALTHCCLQVAFQTGSVKQAPLLCALRVASCTWLNLRCCVQAQLCIPRVLYALWLCYGE